MCAGTAKMERKKMLLKIKVGLFGAERGIKKKRQSYAPSKGCR